MKGLGSRLKAPSLDPVGLRFRVWGLCPWDLLAQDLEWLYSSLQFRVGFRVRAS